MSVYNSKRGEMNHTESITTQSKFYTSISISSPVPTAPIVRERPLDERKNCDPSSAHRTDKYPIPSFFDYRIKMSR
jgi:hypothetical protein